MAFGAFFLLTAFAPVAASSGIIVFRDAIGTRGKAVLLGDAANLSALPKIVRLRAASLVLIDSRMTQTEHAVPHQALAARVRARMPGLGPWLAESYTGSLSIGAKPRLGRIVAISDGSEGAIAGKTVTISVNAGIFTIERKGTAMQAAKPGEYFFVRTPDGVLAAECCRGGKQ